MDRLICGDVGYGKTEVAIRAAFKAVMDSKQVVYLVPTTILAQQHYNSFKERMEHYPIEIAMLSRFCTPKEQKRILDGLKNGSIDIVIGTHKVLSKSIKYKNLGLLIIDEEQRFGVKQKEKIKQLKKDVDVLALSATPIPRTLHMSLAGIRDMSVLEVPPVDRRAIQTYVMEYNEELVREAIERELGRGGQVYYVYNRVNNIDEVAAQLQKLLPDATVEYAHGQMGERQLESIMTGFINKEIVLDDADGVHVGGAVQHLGNELGQLAQADAAGNALAAGLGVAQLQKRQRHFHRAQARRAGGDPALHIAVKTLYHGLSPAGGFDVKSAQNSSTPSVRLRRLAVRRRRTDIGYSYRMPQLISKVNCFRKVVYPMRNFHN